MRAYTFDVESVELTEDECAEFAQIVLEWCHRPYIASLSMQLTGCVRPWHDLTIESVARQVQYMWKTEARL